ncbi:MAG: hypothetical protein K2O18_19025 [Oscillospiraceae bacterium]|nr:hypothetical protein [Oscillospiraceae bacterium]
MNTPAAILPVLLLCLLGSFLGLGNTNAPEKTLTVSPAELEEPAYQLDTMTAQNVFAADTGTELAHYSYQLLTLSVLNADALSQDSAGLARRNTENFNARMIELMNESVEVGREVGNDALEVYRNTLQDIYFYDETAASGQLCGQLISVRVDHGSYAGGAHDNTHVYSYLFDLTIGQFVDPSQIAENPAEFQKKAAAALLEKAEALELREQYWSDYAEILAQWNEGTVLFDEEGMLVIYSSGGLGPYAMGEVELRLSCEELSELAGPGSLERLGIQPDEEP